MYTDLFKAFDAWEDLYKAKKAKGLDNWARLEHLATKLAGKHSRDITFTCSHPKHGSGDKHNLGSTEGNLHFLLGYGNPGFHLAPYHWQIIYPDLEDDEAATLAAERGHPSQPKLWEKSGIAADFEGDQELGTPHQYAHMVRKVAAKKQRMMKAKSRYGSYTVDPVEGLVYEAGTDRIYKWDLVKTSYFAYENPDIVEAIGEQDQQVTTKSVQVPEILRHMAITGTWSDDVYPLVKSWFPEPGSIVTIPVGKELVYGLIRPSSLALFDAVGHPVEFEQYDRAYKSLDFRRGGETHPSILYNFAVRYLGVDGESIMSVVKAQEQPVEEDLPGAVVGVASPGYEHVSPSYTENLNKSVILQDHKYVLVVKN
jgi:hypothetical protein